MLTHRALFMRYLGIIYVVYGILYLRYGVIYVVSGVLYFGSGESFYDGSDIAWTVARSSRRFISMDLSIVKQYIKCLCHLM